MKKQESMKKIVFIKEHVLMKFPDSGRSKGFGFVVYEHAEDLDRYRNVLGEKLLFVQLTSPKRHISGFFYR